MGKMKRVLKVICLLLVPMAFFLLYLGARAVAWRWQRRESLRRESALEGRWSTNHFVLLVDRASLEEAVKSRLVDENLAISQTQLRGLAQSVVNMLVAYSSGSSADYARFRFPLLDPDKLWWNSDWVNTQRGLLAKMGVKAAQTANSFAANIEVCCRFFEMAGALTNKAGARLYATDCWIGAAIDSLNVTLTQSASDNYSPIIAVMGQGNVNLVRPQPAALYSAERVIKARKKALFVLIRCVVQSRQGVPAYPVYATFWWDPDDAAWLPRELMITTIPSATEQLVF